MEYSTLQPRVSAKDRTHSHVYAAGMVAIAARLRIGDGWWAIQRRAHPTAELRELYCGDDFNITHKCRYVTIGWRLYGEAAFHAMQCMRPIFGQRDLHPLSCVSRMRNMQYNAVLQRGGIVSDSMSISLILQFLTPHRGIIRSTYRFEGPFFH